MNRVLTPRPPGSNFKPFVYGAALEAGFSASSIINDAPFARGDYRPNNYENNFLGPITLRHALKESAISPLSGCSTNWAQSQCSASPTGWASGPGLSAQ